MRGVQGAGSGRDPEGAGAGWGAMRRAERWPEGPPFGGEARLTISVWTLGSPRRAAAQPGEGLVVGNAGGPHNPPANPPGLPTPLPRHGGAAGSASSPPKAAVAARGLCPELPPSLCASRPGPSPRSMTQRVTWEPPLHPRTRARRCLRRHFRAPEPGSRAPGQSQERGHRIGVAALRGLRLGFPALGW